MAKVYKVDNGESRHIVYADSTTQVKMWWLAQHQINITSASPKEVFDFYQNSGQPVILAKGVESEKNRPKTT